MTLQGLRVGVCIIKVCRIGSSDLAALLEKIKVDDFVPAD